MIIPLLHTFIRRHLIRQGVESKTIRIGGTDVHYYEAGRPQSPSIVLVHGLGTSSSTWTHLLPVLSRTHHVVSPDLPGFGFSGGESGRNERTISSYADFLEEFIDRVLEGPFILLGHSFGGWVAMKYAIRHRSSVQRLILVNSAGVYYDGVEEIRDLFDLRSTRDTTKLLNRIWGNYPWYFRPFTPFVFEDLVRRKVPEIVRLIEEHDFLNADLHNLTMPVDVIWGMDDRLIPEKALQIFSEMLPARRIYTIPGSGHVPQLEAPEKLTKLLTKILGESSED